MHPNRQRGGASCFTACASAGIDDGRGVGGAVAQQRVSPRVFATVGGWERNVSAGAKATAMAKQSLLAGLTCASRGVSSDALPTSALTQRLGETDLLVREGRLVARNPRLSQCTFAGKLQSFGS